MPEIKVRKMYKDRKFPPKWTRKIGRKRRGEVKE